MATAFQQQNYWYVKKPKVGKVVPVDAKHTIIYLNMKDQYLSRMVTVDLGNKWGSIMTDTAEHSLLSDVFWALYHWRLEDSGDQRYPYNRELLTKLLASPEFAVLREKTASRLSISRAIAPELFRQLLLDEAEQEKVKGQNGAGNANGEDVIEGSGGGQSPAQTEQEIVTAVTDAIETATNLENAAIAWGLGDGNPTKIDFEELTRLTKLLNKGGLGYLSSLIGRLKEAVNAAIASEDMVEGFTPRAIDLSRQLDLLLEEELISLHPSNPLVYEAYEKYDQSGLLSWELMDIGDESGDFLVSLDGSGSMSGDPDLYSKAVTLTLCNIAHEQGRRFIISEFSGSDTDKLREVSSESTLEERVKWFSKMDGGGTDFNAPVRWFTKHLEENKATNTLRNPDLLLITDGAGRVSDYRAEALSDLLGELNARLMVVYIGQGSYSHELTALADYTLTLTSLAPEAIQAFAEEAGRLLLTRKTRERRGQAK